MRLIAWFALVAMIAPAAAAQTRTAQSLRVGKVALSLGMPQKTALAALKGQFHVERARSAGDDWAVMDREKTVAIVSFSAGQLSRVSRTWTSSGDRGATALADQIYALAGKFAKQGRTECTLAAKPYQVAKVEGRIVTLACGNKSIQLIESRTHGSGWVTSLQEVLQ